MIIFTCFFDRMGSQSSSFCGEATPSIVEPLPTDVFEDTNLTHMQASLDPLKKFLCSSSTLKVKTLNQLITYSGEITPKPNIGGIQQPPGKAVSVDRVSLEQQIADRILRRSSLNFSGEGSSMIMHLLEEQIQQMAQEKTEQGQCINAGNIDRTTVFRKLKIDIASFIRVIHGSAAQHYHFKETIGQGSFGKVYRAVCKRTKQERAIKVLKHKITRKEDAKFLAQFNLLSQLDHPNIVKLYEIYYYRSFYYVVMEYCRGGCLIQLIKRLKQFPEALVVSIAQQLLAALAYLHQQGIVHRDIKLDNIVFIEPQGGSSDYHIKLIDFGTAVRRGEVAGKMKMAGTRYYMAPEVFKGLLHEKSDLWSCGVFLYVFFTGRFPFPGKTLAEVQQTVCSKTVTFVEHEWKEVSMQARRLILGLLQRSLEKRLSAKDALAHPWFKKILPSNEPPTYSTCNLQLLQKYQRGNNLIAIIQNYLSLSQISQQERERLAVVFRRLDTNKDGSISASQLMALYRSHFGEENQQQVQNILARIDQNQSGKIDFNQFLLAMYTRKRLFLENALTDAFRHYDANQDGYLQRGELKALLQGCEREEVEYLLQELDADGDERVSLGEFLNYMRKFS